MVLPCHLEPPLVVEWSRQDLRPVQYVHVYRDHGEVTDMKTESYTGRTALFPEELKRGNMSLKVRAVTPRSPAQDSTVQLVVGECVLVGGRWTPSVLDIMWAVFSLAADLRSETERTVGRDLDGPTWLQLSRLCCSLWSWCCFLLER